MLKLKIKIISLLLSAFCLLSCLSSCGKVDNSMNEKADEASQSADAEELIEIDDALTRDEVFKKVKQSIVKVLVYDYDGKTLISQGSGFFIDKMGTFITNAHVIKGAYYIKAQTFFGKLYDVDMIFKYNDSASDYAICRMKDSYSSEPVEFTTEARAGDLVYALGYPNDSFDISATSGKIVSTNAVFGEKQYYTNTARINHGSSGGALVDHQGRVLGITTGISSGGEYVALKYQSFSAEIAGVLEGGKTPMEQFHGEIKYQFDKSTISEYFEIYVNVTDYTDSSISYEIGARLKEQYQGARMVLDTEGLSVITVEVVTKYNFYAAFGKKLEQDSKVVHLHFSTLEEMKKGKSQEADSASNDFDPDTCYDMEISYEADFWDIQNGALTIYN